MLASKHLPTRAPEVCASHRELPAWRPVAAEDTGVITVTVPMNGVPGNAWHLGGLSAQGEPAAVPGIDPATGDWILPLTATPLVVTIEPQEEGMSYVGNDSSPESNLFLSHQAAEHTSQRPVHSSAHH